MKLGLKLKILLPLILLNFCAFLAHYYIFKSTIHETLLKEFTSKGVALSSSLASSVQDTLLNRDASTIQGFIDRFKTISGVKYIFIVNDKKEIAAHTFTPVIPPYFLKLAKEQSLEEEKKTRLMTIEDKQIIDIEAPILAGLLGRVYVGMGLSDKEDKILRMALIKSIITGGTISTISILVTIIILYLLLTPISNLTKLTQKVIASNNLNIKAETNQKDEVGDLARSFNAMIDSLREHNENLEETIKERTKVIEAQKSKLVESARLSSLGEMAGGIAHEINNPLAIIKSNIYYIKKLASKNKLSDENILAFIKDLEVITDRIGRIILGLKNVSRQKQDNDFQRAPLTDIFDDVLSLCMEKIKIQNIDFKIDLDSIQPIEILCDRVQISQVLINLIGNSIDAIKDLEEKWIKIDFKLAKDSFKIFVIDSGSGIPQEVQAKMFDPFYTSKDIGKGTGLGLSISKNIIENHKGKLTLDSNSDHTCFIIEFGKDSFNV